MRMPQYLRFGPTVQLLGRWVPASDVTEDVEHRDGERGSLKDPVQGETLRGFQIRRRHRDGTPLDLSVSSSKPRFGPLDWLLNPGAAESKGPVDHLEAYSIYSRLKNGAEREKIGASWNLACWSRRDAPT